MQRCAPGCHAVGNHCKRPGTGQCSAVGAVEGSELSAAAEQMLKLSRNLLDSMDRFALDRSVHTRSRRQETTPPRRSTEAPRDSEEFEYAELMRP